MIADMMLEESSRQLRIEVVAQRARGEFGEASIREVKSRYFQILDENILIEQKPMGASFNLYVSFVYEEFMEYVLARSLWHQMLMENERVLPKDIIGIVKRLFTKEEKFVAVLGMAIYLGEFIVRQSPQEGLVYLDWLIEQQRIAMACRLIERWPRLSLSDDVFSRLFMMNDQGIHSPDVWRVIEPLSLAHWKMFWKRLHLLPLTGRLRPLRIFALLGRVGGGNTAAEKLETIKWIISILKKIPHARSGGDHTTGMKAIERIEERAKLAHYQDELKELPKLIRAAKRL
jgi:hypothetical protein